MLAHLLRRHVVTSTSSRHRASAQQQVHTLVLLRHGESEWNKQNRFTGWADVPLSTKGHEEAQAAGKALLAEHFVFDRAYTSYLQRAIRTLWHVLEQSDQMSCPQTPAWELNERHYGGLTGLDKQETLEHYGRDQVMMWRRSFDIPPPDLDRATDHGRRYYPGHAPAYAKLNLDTWPSTESLLCTMKRVLPYWQDQIVPDIRQGQRVLITAHGNSLRALIKHLDGISSEDITELNIPTGIPLVYELDEDTLAPIRHAQAMGLLSGRYVGDQAEIQAKILGVKNQTK